MIARTDKATITRVKRNAEYYRALYKQMKSPWLFQKWTGAVKSANTTITRLKEKYAGEQTEFDFSTINPQL